MDAKSIGSPGGTGRQPSAPSASAASFSRDLQQLLGTAGEKKPASGGAAQGGAPGKAKGAGGAGAAADPKIRKGDSAAQESVGAGLFAMPQPGGFAAGAQAWSLDAGRPLASTAGNSSDGMVSAPGASPQSMDLQNGVPTPAGLLGASAMPAVAAAGASIASGDAGFLPETPETRGEADSVVAAGESPRLAEGTAPAGSAAPKGSGGGGLLVSSDSAVFGAETGLAAAARQAMAKDSAALGSRRLEGAGPVAGKGQGGAQGAIRGVAQGAGQSSTPTAPVVASAPSIPGESAVAGRGEPAPGAGSSPAPSGEGAGASINAFSAFSAPVPAPFPVPLSGPADTGSDGAAVSAWTVSGASPSEAAGSKWKGAPGEAGPSGGGSVPFAGHLLPALAFPPMAAGGVATGDGLGGPPLSAPGAQSSAASGGGHAAASPSEETSPTAGEVSMAATHLLQSLGRSEMQVHLNAAEFGRVSVHATYGREGIAAQISLENTDLGSALGSALSAHLPAMEQKLGADGGARASVSVSTETGAGSGNGGGQGTGPSPRRSSPPSLPSPLSSSDSLPAIDAAGSLLSIPMSSGAASGRRLDIRI